MSFHNHKIKKRAKPPLKFSFSEMGKKCGEALKKRGEPGDPRMFTQCYKTLSINQLYAQGKPVMRRREI